MLSVWTFLLLNGFCFPLHLGDGGSFPPPLSAREEQECLNKMADGDLEARNRLVEHNLRLVSHILKKYYIQPGGQDDLISIGTIGLIKGISTFKPDKKVKLATYASKCIENEILMYFRQQKKRQGDISLSEAIDGDESNTLSLMDVIRVDDDLLERLDAQTAHSKVRASVFRDLSERESRIIALRYGLDGASPRTQREVAAQCGISRSYVSRLEKKALEKLKRILEPQI